MSMPSESSAFPSDLLPEVKLVVAQLSAGQLHPASDPFVAYINGEKISIPRRVYYQETLLLRYAALPGRPGLIASCLGTRHYNGFLREKCLAQLLLANEPWVAPYVVQLIGEYVLPIVESIERSIPQLSAQTYCAYIAENRLHYKVTQSRAASYWDAYHRATYPRWKNYPGYRAFVALNSLCRRL